MKIEVHEIREMAFNEIKEQLYLGKEEALLIEKAGKEEEFMGFLDQWKEEEALPHHGCGYWTLQDIDEWLAFDWEYIAEILGIEEEEEA